jgi:hypothetical protein
MMGRWVGNSQGSTVGRVLRYGCAAAGLSLVVLLVSGESASSCTYPSGPTTKPPPVTVLIGKAREQRPLPVETPPLAPEQYQLWMFEVMNVSPAVPVDVLVRIATPLPPGVLRSPPDGYPPPIGGAAYHIITQKPPAGSSMLRVSPGACGGGSYMALIESPLPTTTSATNAVPQEVASPARTRGAATPAIVVFLLGAASVALPALGTGIVIGRKGRASARPR